MSEKNGTPDLPDRRKQRAERRARPRGGRRRTDRPEDAGVVACAFCGHPYPTLVAMERAGYQWHCPGCRRRFVTRRAARVVL